MNLHDLPDLHIAPAAALHALIEESLGHPPEFGAGMSSHLPMALAALHALGADAAQMRRFATAYLQRSGLALCRARRPEPAALGDWQALRGRVEAFAALQAHFGAALERAGSSAVLREALPALMRGMAGAAFHGLIRTAHAFESGHAGELAAALAYWAARWWQLPPGDAGLPRAQSAEGWLQSVELSLVQHGAQGLSKAPSVAARMVEATRTTTYRALAAGPLRDAALGDILPLLAHTAAQRYLQTGNFTVLHMVTATRAALVLAPLCPRASHPAIRTALWRATLAARIASGTGRLPPPAQPKPPAPAAEAGWREIRAAACQSLNDHTIKLVHTVHWLARHADEAGASEAPVWQAAARRALG